MLAIRAKRVEGVGPGNPTWKQIGGVTEVEALSVLLEPAEASITPYSEATSSSAKCIRLSQAMNASVLKQN